MCYMYAHAASSPKTGTEVRESLHGGSEVEFAHSHKLAVALGCEARAERPLSVLLQSSREVRVCVGPDALVHFVHECGVLFTWGFGPMAEDVKRRAVEYRACGTKARGCRYGC